MRQITPRHLQAEVVVRTLYNSIQQAVDAAASGDVIQVCPGTYDEQVEIAKPLTLVGVKRNEKKAAVVQPSNMQVNSDLNGDPLAATILVRDTSEVTIRNITVDGINNGIVCDPTPPFIDGIFYRNVGNDPVRGNKEYAYSGGVRLRRWYRYPGR